LVIILRGNQWLRWVWTVSQYGACLRVWNRR